MPIKHRIIPDMTPQQIERFWKRVRISAPDECWLWIGCTCAGYGYFGLNYDSFYANRIAYYLHYQKDPGDLHALHTCDNPPCCNPAHLFLGTTADNARDMVAKGRSLKGDRSYSRQHPEKVRRGDAHWSRRNPEKCARGDQSGARLHPDRIRRGDEHGLRVHLDAAQRGSKRWNARLKEEDIPIVRALASAGEMTYKAIGDRFNVSWSTILDAVMRRTWKDIP